MTQPPYPFRIDLLSVLSIGTGEPSLFADSAIPRWPDGRAFVPATTLKGAARDAARVAGFAREDVEAAFGAPDGAGSRVAITDAVPADGVVPVVREVTSVALSPQRAPVAGALAVFEVIQPLVEVGDGWSRASFHGQVRPSPTIASAQGMRAAAVFLAALAQVRSLGARTRRGWGQVRVAMPAASVAHARTVLEEPA